MIKFFRTIRQNLLVENKTGKYVKYAIGEIILVMIGILLALQVNTWNQNQGIKKQLKNYRTSLLSEIEKDLKELERIDSLNASATNQINEYFALYNSGTADPDSLLSKKRETESGINNFKSNIYSIDELIGSGNISLFKHEEKRALVYLKKQIDLYTYYEKQTAATLTNTWDRLANIEDVAFQSGLTTNQNAETKKLASDVNSDYFRYFHNGLARTLGYYQYQDYIYAERIRPELIKLKDILSENKP